MSQGYFVYRRRVAYHETDAMGVVHHSNHVKYFEEARVAWLRDKGLIEAHSPLGPYTFAVVDLTARYSRPATFEDDLEICVEGRMEGAKIAFQYAIWSPRQECFIAEGQTALVPLDRAMKPTRLPQEMRQLFSDQKWSADWPPPALHAAKRK